MARPRNPRNKEEAQQAVLDIAWKNAADAMKTIAEAAKDGDVGAAYYIVNRTLGRPSEAPKDTGGEHYGELLERIRGIRARDLGAEPEGTDAGGEASTVGGLGLPPESGAVGGAYSSPSEEDDSGRGASWEELFGGE